MTNSTYYKPDKNRTMLFEITKNTSEPEIHLWADAGDDILDVHAKWNNKGVFEVRIKPRLWKGLDCPKYIGTISVEKIREAEKLADMAVGVSTKDAKTISNYVNMYASRTYTATTE